tara:strand:- start:625 stop:768 length:144 start_codon:yes stop_codon:yes gene_type:complete
MDGQSTRKAVEELEGSFDEQGRKTSPTLPSTTDMVLRTVQIEAFDDE